MITVWETLIFQSSRTTNKTTIFSNIIQYCSPTRIVVQQIRISDDYEQDFGPAEGHVHSSRNWNKAETVLQVERNILFVRSHSWEYHNVEFLTLKFFYTTHFWHFELRLVQNGTDFLHLQKIWKNDEFMQIRFDLTFKLSKVDIEKTKYQEVLHLNAC